MTHPRPHPSDRPVRILFVLAWLEAGDAAQIGLLAQSLDPARYRIDVLPCLRLPGATDQTSLSVKVDRTACALSYEDTVLYLEQILPGYDVVISCQDVADIYPALDRLRHRPPLIEWGRLVPEALSGPKHFTTRYVGQTEDIRAAAASRMPDRPQHARMIPPMTRGGKAMTLWRDLFDEVVANQQAVPPTIFRSFMQGGFECSSQRLHTGRRLDVIAATRHDTLAENDYRQLTRHGLRTIRDGARWHLIETAPGRYDFTSFIPMVDAARNAGTQVIWDLFHYGWPDDLDIWSPAFVDRFARFAAATARVLRDRSDGVPFWCPVNEISFLSWAGGDVRYLNPFATGRGFELKVQLARASIAAMHALREVDPRARFVHCEPLIAIHHDPALAPPRGEAVGWHNAQFQALDLLAGWLWPQIGGEPSFLDVVGVNYYSNNQWIHGGPPIDMDHPLYRPLSDLLFETYARYHRPILISETGVEGDRRAPWLRYVGGEVDRARRRGVPVEGICLYPIMDHPGWDDDRYCANGLLMPRVEGRARAVVPDLAAAVAELVRHFDRGQSTAQAAE